MAADAPRCEVPEPEPHLADLIVSRIANGPIETSYWCNDHYLAVCLAVIQAAAEAEAAQAAEDAEARLAAAASSPTESPASSDAGPADPGEPGRPGDGPPDADLDQTPPDQTTAVLGRSRRAGGAKAADAAGA